MPLNDLRDCIQTLRSFGEIQDIALPVALDLEVSAIARRCYETGAPAPLFSNFSDHTPGFRVLGAPAGLSRQPGLRLARVAVSLGLPATSGGLDIVRAIAESLTLPAIDPVKRHDAACFDNVLIDEAVDLNLLPLSTQRPGDSLHRLSAWGCVVAQTPDGTWTDWSIAHLMPTGTRRELGLCTPSRHLQTIVRSWADSEHPMPFALALGVMPSIPFICGMPLPAQVNKAGRLGALLRRPIETTLCRTIALEAPASAEILIEGYLERNEILECHMGDLLGFNWAENIQKRFICRVTAISHRDKAILPVIGSGEPVEEYQTAYGIPAAAQFLHELRGAGLAVTDVWLPLEAAQHWIIVTVPRDWRRKSGVSGSDAFCRRIGERLFMHIFEGAIPKIIVINDDVNPAANDEILWALATRCHPENGRVHCGHIENGYVHTDKIVYNCLPPEEWGEVLPIRASFRHGYPSHIVERVLSRWEAYGFREIN